MPTSTAVFKSNKTQAVRLPKDVAFPPEVKEVDILVVGNGRLIVPKGQRWDDFFERGPHVSDDFMAERVQPPVRKRKRL
jgi:antitoxin VapB